MSDLLTKESTQEDRQVEQNADPEAIEDKLIAELSEDGKFYVRKVVTEDGGAAYFKFFVIDSAQKWEKASALQCKQIIDIGDSKMSVTANCVSLASQEMMEINHEIPQWRVTEKEPTNDFLEKQKKAESLRTIALLETGLGKSIPGSSDDEKISWLNQMSPAQIDALEDFINGFLCCLSEGFQITEYTSIMSRVKQKNEDVKEFVDFESWKSASECQYTLRWSRPFQDFICEMPMRSVTKETRDKVERECKPPTPTKRPKLDANGRPTRELEPNFDDPKWKKESRAIAQKKTAMLLDAALPFEIPGSSDSEKYQWICEHTTGDVLRVKNFIEQEMLEYNRSYDFFTNAFGL